MLLPIITPEGPKDIGVPEIVAAGAPSVSVVPPIAIAAPLAVKVWPPRTKVDEGPWVGRGMVELPSTRPEGPRDMTVPDIVMAGAPCDIVCPAISTLLAKGVMTWPAMAKTAREAENGMDIVLDPIKRPVEPREIAVPEIVTAGAPCVMVWPNVTISDG